MGGPWDKPSTDSESDKTRWLSKGNPEKNAPYKWFYLSQVYHSFPEPAHVTIYMLSFSLLPSTLFKFIYTKSEVQGLVTGYWPLRPGAWDSELSMPQPDFNLCPGNQNPSPSCCRLSRLRSKLHCFIQWTTLHSAKATTFKNHHFRVGENEFSDYKDFTYFNENIINILSLSNFLLYSNLNE